MVEGILKIGLNCKIAVKVDLVQYSAIVIPRYTGVPQGDSRCAAV